MQRLARILGTLLVVAGLGTLAWVGVVWRWQDPFTSLYTRWKQHGLAESYTQRIRDFRPSERRFASVAEQRRAIAHDARRYRRSSRRGEAIARIDAPRLGIDMVVVNGTDQETLKRGPGRHLRTFMPGEGELVYIAGHRTTYLAPFARIDALRRGDRIRLELPYATFVYAVTRERIVPAHAVGVLRSRHREEMILQACHPRFFATHRYLAYARPVRVIPRDGPAFAGTDAESAGRP